MDEEPSSSRLSSFMSKDGKIWSSVPIVGRPRAENYISVCRGGPVTATMRNPSAIFKSFQAPEIVRIIVRVKEKEIYTFIDLTLFAGVFESNGQPSHELWGKNGNPIYMAMVSTMWYKLMFEWWRYHKIHSTCKKQNGCHRRYLEHAHVKKSKLSRKEE